MSTSSAAADEKKQQLKGLKVVIKKKKKRPIKRKVGLPSIATPKQSVAVAQPPAVEQQELLPDDEFDDTSLALDELPCDTLLLLRSIEKLRTCLYIPLQEGGLIPTVLESQLYQRIAGSGGEDSVVTQELHTLHSNNQIRRLVPPDDETITAWVETRYYVRAVWDAHRSHQASIICNEEMKNLAVKVTSWFLSNLKNWTKRSIPVEALKEAWKSTASSIHIDKVIDMLVDMQVLLPTTRSTFLLWLPQWGAVLAAVDKAQSKVIAHIKRSLYKELSVRTVEGRQYPGGLSGSFVIHTLTMQAKVERVARPSGDFLRMPK